ncbi:hypothetical protein SNEBB_010556 [Seison nebaliae]|nr:hypothetical protein SNEBB_010556 [Seison nebaliae]
MRRKKIEKASLNVGSTIKDGKLTYRILSHLGEGSFGNVYQAANVDNEKNEKVAVKIEPQHSGALFCEMNFYVRTKKSKIELSEGCVDYLPVSKCFSGGVDLKQTDGPLRYVVLELYDDNLDNYLTNYTKNDVTKFVNNVFHWTRDIMTGLEFIHRNKYVHGDIKAENLLFHRNNMKNLYISDFGNVERYDEGNGGKCKEYKPEKNQKHQGTLQFTSIDAHKGITYSRRGDLETLLFNVIYWLTGNLSWFDMKSKEKVLQEKIKFISSHFTNCDDFIKFKRKHSKTINLSIDKSSLTTIANFIKNYLKLLKDLKFKETPCYEKFYQIVNSAIKSLMNEKSMATIDNSSATVNFSISGKRYRNSGSSSPQRFSKTYKYSVIASEDGEINEDEDNGKNFIKKVQINEGLPVAHRTRSRYKINYE